jgi:hypothetical protein
VRYNYGCEKNKEESEEIDKEDGEEVVLLPVLISYNPSFFLLHLAVSQAQSSVIV